MLRRHIFFLFASACLAMATPVMAKPDFTGSWKIVMDKSDFGPMPPPENVERLVEQKDNDFKVNVTQVGQQGEFKIELTYSTEKETTNTFRNTPMKSTAKWDGEKLVIHSKLDYQGNEIVMQETWSLADDGKTLVSESKVNTPQGEIEMKQVFSKQ